MDVPVMTILIIQIESQFTNPMQNNWLTFHVKETEIFLKLCSITVTSSVIQCSNKACRDCDLCAKWIWQFHNVLSFRRWGLWCVFNRYCEPLNFGIDGVSFRTRRNNPNIQVKFTFSVIFQHYKLEILHKYVAMLDTDVQQLFSFSPFF